MGLLVYSSRNCTNLFCGKLNEIIVTLHRLLLEIAGGTRNKKGYAVQIFDYKQFFCFVTLLHIANLKFQVYATGICRKPVSFSLKEFDSGWGSSGLLFFFFLYINSKVPNGGQRSVQLWNFFNGLSASNVSQFLEGQDCCWSLIIVVAALVEFYTRINF